MSTSKTLEKPSVDRAAAAPAGATPLATPSRGAVLVATHGAETSDAAVRWAYTYATQHQLPLDVVAAVMPIMVPAEYGGSYVDLDRIQREAVQECVTGQLARVINGTLPGITLETGFPIDIVSTRASAQASGMIVVGRGRPEMLTRLLGGETVLGILRRTRTPVLAVASNAGWRPSVVVIATDFSPAAARAAELAVALIGQGATIHLVHVQSAFDRAAADPARETVYAAGVREMFEQLRHRLVLYPGTVVRTHLVCGDPAEMLLQVAREEHADLIATGTQSKGFMDRLTLGSVAEHVLRSAPCSVLVAPDPVA